MRWLDEADEKVRREAEKAEENRIKNLMHQKEARDLRKRLSRIVTRLLKDMGRAKWQWLGSSVTNVYGNYWECSNVVNDSYKKRFWSVELERGHFIIRSKNKTVYTKGTSEEELKKCLSEAYENGPCGRFT
jgi:hypothetical protein